MKALFEVRSSVPHQKNDVERVSSSRDRAVQRGTKFFLVFCAVTDGHPSVTAILGWSGLVRTSTDQAKSPHPSLHMGATESLATRTPYE